MRYFLLFLSLLSFINIDAQVTIRGYAPAYVGETIEAYKTLDYFSNKEVRISSTTVKPDSSFTLYINSDITQKITLKANNNKGFLLVQPKANYELLFPEKDKFTPNRPNGNLVEVAFYNLDSTDINYKILGFQRWVDYYLGNNYFKKSQNNNDFAESLDRFKTRVEKAYKNDTSSYFKVHVKFTIAGLDNIPNAAERNRYEKHDFYIKYNPVHYNNETYMLYISDFYQKLMPRLSNQANEEVYEGILNSSPTIIMNALGSEYTLINLRIRELIMIKALTEVYNSDDYPQTNIITILDSLSNKCLFSTNQEIAKNLRARITDLVPGGKAPDLVLMEENVETKTLYSFQGRYLYLHFFDPESQGCQKELPLLLDMQTKYGENIQFVTIKKQTKSVSDAAIKNIQTIPWDVYSLSQTNSIWKKYGIESFPQYTLIDAAGYIVASPALGPTPNGQYETIDKTFFYINKAMSEKK